MISFLLNDTPVNIENADPNTTLQQYVRESLGFTGTKEGCASGDCGACTLVIAEPDTDQSSLKYYTVNSCITVLAAVHGKQLIIPEHLASGEELHAVQRSLVDHHGSQCGFCTPGFIMSMFSLYKQKSEVNRQQIDSALSGNLCRCTGYRPIIDATMEACNAPDKKDKFSEAEVDTLNQLHEIASQGPMGDVHLPETRQQLANLVEQHPEATFVCGGTDLMLEVTQNLTSYKQLINLSRVDELTAVKPKSKGIEIGSSVTLTQLQKALSPHFPELDELLERFASTPIRNQASIGGNIANASPIGDLPPVLMALHSRLTLDNGKQQRDVPINAFFTDYRKTHLRPGEWIANIFVPYKGQNSLVAAYKVSKRFEDDISAVCGVFHLVVENGIIAEVSTGFGGVAATPVQALTFQQQLTGLTFSDPRTRDLGATLLLNAFTPLSDVRASAEYRNTIVANLWRRFWYQHAQPQIKTRVIQHA